MRKLSLQRIILYVALLLWALLCVTGCGRGNEDETQSQQTEEEQGTVQNIFLILEHNTQEEAMNLYSLTTGLLYYYEYGFSTRFKDKYGSFASAAEFTPGRCVVIAPRDKDGYLTEVQFSDQVWEYEKVRRFRIEEEKGIMTIADTKYSLQEKVKVFSNGREISFSDISQDDILTVVGTERKIISVIVTTGHGTLALKNTDLFEDSFLQLGSNIFAMITPDLEIEVPEGEYDLTVANDGWGGTTKIEIARGETTEIDLETLKGEGKKKGLITFLIAAEDVVVYVDYQKIDHTKPVELTYGTHVLKIDAKGYDVWKKYLSVNSEEATIMIELTESAKKENSKEETTESEKATETEKEEATESLETSEI